MRQCTDTVAALLNSELYVIVNGKPTKGNVVWRNLVNVNQIKTMFWIHTIAIIQITITIEKLNLSAETFSTKVIQLRTI